MRRDEAILVVDNEDTLPTWTKAYFCSVEVVGRILAMHDIQHPAEIVADVDDCAEIQSAPSVGEAVVVSNDANQGL